MPLRGPRRTRPRGGCSPAERSYEVRANHVTPLRAEESRCRRRSGVPALPQLDIRSHAGTVGVEYPREHEGRCEAWPLAPTCFSPEAGGADGTPDPGTRTGGELPGCRCRSSIEERKRQCSARLWAASERVGRPRRTGRRSEVSRDRGSSSKRAPLLLEPLTVTTGAPPTSAVVSGAVGLQSGQTNAPAARFSPGWALGANSMPSSARTPPGPRVEPSQRS
jgi:hypothetical protein